MNVLSKIHTVSVRGPDGRYANYSVGDTVHTTTGKVLKVIEIQCDKTSNKPIVTVFMDDGSHTDCYDVVQVGYVK